MKYLYIIAALGAALVVVGVVTQGINTDSAATPIVPPSESVLKTLSSAALAGRQPFERSCAECHGGAGQGTKQGPPLVNSIYNPGHHADESFYRAIHSGVQQHHWRFGDMPRRPEVTDAEIPKIIRYVRELQEANGIFYEPHRM